MPRLFGGGRAGASASRTLKGGRLLEARPTQPGAQQPRWCVLCAHGESYVLHLSDGRSVASPTESYDGTRHHSRWQASAGAPVAAAPAGALLILHLEKSSDERSEVALLRL